MDKAGRIIYRPVMFRLLVPIVTAFVLALVSFTASAHATGMAVSTPLAGPMQHIVHDAVQKPSCTDGMNCMPDAGLCDLVCTGAGVFLPPARLASGMIAKRQAYASRPEAALVATPPGLDDRPPIARLL